MTIRSRHTYTESTPHATLHFQCSSVASDTDNSSFFKQQSSQKSMTFVNIPFSQSFKTQIQQLYEAIENKTKLGPRRTRDDEFKSRKVEEVLHMSTVHVDSYNPSCYNFLLKFTPRKFPSLGPLSPPNSRGYVQQIMSFKRCM